jgi:acyl-CoA synthetase (NDP forming)
VTTNPGWQTLDAFFAPRSVAVIGASADRSRAGGRVLQTLATAGYPGRVIPVNPNQTQINDLPCHPSILAVPEPVDLVAICVPAERVPDIIRECGRAGVRGAVVFADGFRDEALRAALADAHAEARTASGLRIIGPNTIGIRHSESRAYVTFSSATESELMPGPIATIAQSGGMSGVLGVTQLRRRGLGPRCVIDTGNEFDVDLADCIDYVADDPGTTCISVLAEGARDGRRLAAAIRHASERGKHVVFLKTGRSAAALDQVASHTGALAGRAELFDAAIRDAGACVVRDEMEMMDAVVLHGFNRVPKGRRLGAVTPSGGYAILAVDAAEQFGMEFPPPVIAPTAEQREQVKLGTFDNPFDMSSTISSGPRGLETSLHWMASQPNIDAILLWQAAILDTPAPQPRVLAALADLVAHTDKPVFGCGLTTPEFQARLREIGVLWFEEPTRLVRALSVVAPPATPHAVPAVAATHRRVVTGSRARDVLGDLPDLAHVPTIAVTDAASAQRAMQALGVDRVILKVESEHIAHKTEFGFVSGPVSAAELARTFTELEQTRSASSDPSASIVLQPLERGIELALGAYLDPAFGPSVMVALGGIYLEIMRDAQFAPAPVTVQQARDMVLRLKAADILRGVRGRPPADIDAAARAIAALSRFIADNAGRYAEIDINPLFVHAEGKGVIAVDALLVERHPDILG